MTKDYLLFQALAHMGNASHQMAWANTCVEDVAEVPEKLKADMKQINVQIHELQEQMRTILNSPSVEQGGF